MLMITLLKVPTLKVPALKVPILQVYSFKIPSLYTPYFCTLNFVTHTVHALIVPTLKVPMSKVQSLKVSKVLLLKILLSNFLRYQAQTVGRKCLQDTIFYVGTEISCFKNYFCRHFASLMLMTYFTVYMSNCSYWMSWSSDGPKCKGPSMEYCAGVTMQEVIHF
jgi:hypothetical protein